MKKLTCQLIVILGVLGVSFSAIFVRYATAPSMTLALYRMAFASILLLPLVLLRNRSELQALSWKRIALCCLSGIVLAFHFTCYFESIRYTSIASSTVLVDTEVFFVAIVSVLLFREKIPRTAVAGIFLTFIGSVILALSDHAEGSQVVYGDGLALAGAAFVAVYTLIGRRQRSELSTTVYTFLVYTAASVTLLLLCLFTRTPIVSEDAGNYLWGFLMTVFCTFLGHSIFSWGLKYLPAAFISTVKLGEPVFATLLAVLIFAQVPRFQQVIGGLIILGGIVLYTRCEAGVAKASDSCEN